MTNTSLNQIIPVLQVAIGPVILISGTIGETKGGVMVKLGADAFVPKAHLADLLPAIRRQLGLPGDEP